MSLKKTDKLVPVFTPSLVSILVAKENELGRPLSEREVLEIRDGADCVMMTESSAKAAAGKRGYEDVDPKTIGRDWPAIRKLLAGK